MSEKFEQQAKHLLDEVQLEPRAEVWQQVRSAIQPQKKRRRFIFWWLLPVGLAAGSLYYFTVQPNNKPDTSIATHTTPVSTETATKETIPAKETIADHNNTPVSSSADAPSNTPVSVNTPVIVADKNNNVPSTTMVTVTSAQQRRQVSPRSKKNGFEKSGGTSSTVQPVPSQTVVVTSEKITTQSTNTSEVSSIADKEKLPVETATTVTPTDTAGKKTPVAMVTTTPSSKSSVDSQAVTAATPIAVTPNKIRPKWSWGITSDVGLSTASSAALSLFGEKSLNEAFFSGGSLANPTAQPMLLAKRVTASSGITLGLAATIRRQLGKKFAFQGGLGYRYQSFSINASAIKDSVQPSGIRLSIPLNMIAYEYKFHSLHLYTGINMQLFDVNGLHIGLGAGIDQQFLFGSNLLVRTDTYTNPLSTTTTKNTSLAGFHQWQPMMRLQLTADFNINNRKWLQLSPYYNYGLRTYEKNASSSKDHLSAFGITTTFFLK